MTDEKLSKNFMPLEYIEDEIARCERSSPISPGGKEFREMRLEILHEFIDTWRNMESEDKEEWLRRQLSP